jgi:hypothetical protein
LSHADFNTLKKGLLANRTRTKEAMPGVNQCAEVRS